MTEFVQENIISILALCISIISIFISIRKELKALVRIKIKPYDGECVYFTLMDNLICYGIISCRVKITNKSSTECGISDIRLKLGNEVYEAVPFNEIVVTNGSDIKFQNIHTHIPEYMRVNSENIYNNLQLKAYDTRRVYLTFPASVDIPKEIFYGNGKARLILTVAGKKFVFKIKIQLIPAALKQEL